MRTSLIVLSSLYLFSSVLGKNPFRFKKSTESPQEGKCYGLALSDGIDLGPY